MLLLRFLLLLLPLPILLLFSSTSVLGQTTVQGYFTEWEVDGGECNRLGGSVQKEEEPYKYVCLTPEGEKVDLPVKPQGINTYPVEIPGETLNTTEVTNPDGTVSTVIERDYPNIDVEDSESRKAFIGQMADLYMESLKREDTYERTVGDFDAMVKGYLRLVPDGGMEELQENGIQPELGEYTDLTDPTVQPTPTPEEQPQP